MDERYRSKLDELEKKSLYLDRSLEVIEDMRAKFAIYER